ncbi:MAG: hypothetical protein GY725_17195 [bacterium]|nr:hypothetical protein [bacterium]
MINNTEEEIVALTAEVLDIAAGTTKFDEENERLQVRLKDLWRPEHYTYRSGARMGRDFLR